MTRHKVEDDRTPVMKPAAQVQVLEVQARRLRLPDLSFLVAGVLVGVNRALQWVHDSPRVKAIVQVMLRRSSFGLAAMFFAVTAAAWVLLDASLPGSTRVGLGLLMLAAAVCAAGSAAQAETRRRHSLISWSVAPAEQLREPPHSLPDLSAGT